MKQNELADKARHAFLSSSVDVMHVTEDGQCFPDANDAASHAAVAKVKTLTFTRSQVMADDGSKKALEDAKEAEKAASAALDTALSAIKTAKDEQKKLDKKATDAAKEAAAQKVKDAEAAFDVAEKAHGEAKALVKQLSKK